MQYIIYLLTNKVNGKVYVGITNDYKKRMREHSYATNDYLISRAIRKHGWENFESRILVETDNREDERLFIAEYDSKNNGYNLTDGGEGTVGFSPSKSTRLKMRHKKLGRTLSESHKKKIGESLIGHSVSNITRKKIGRSKLGNKYFEGRSHSETTKSILSSLKAKTWEVCTPDGSNLLITNMRKFCFDNDLHPGAMSRVVNGKQYSHKGWRASLSTLPTID